METNNESNTSPTPGPDNLDSLKRRYLAHLELKNLSPLTVQQEEQALRFFFAHLAAHGVTSVQAVGRDTVEGFKAAMMAQQTKAGTPLTPGVVRCRLLSVIRWLTFLRKKGVLVRNPAADVQAPKVVRSLPKGVMCEDEVRAVLDLPDTTTTLGQRDRTLLEVVYATGARAFELLDLRLADIDLVKKAATIRRGKGAKGRLAPLTSSAVGHIARYLEVTRPELAKGIKLSGNSWRRLHQTGDDVLFLSSFGAPISSKWLGQMLKGYLHKAGITRRMSPVHGFRHALATHLLGNGLDIRYVQATLGHASIDSTQKYTHVDRKFLGSEVKKHHPRQKGGGAFKPFKDSRTDERK